MAQGSRPSSGISQGLVAEIQSAVQLELSAHLQELRQMWNICEKDQQAIQSNGVAPFHRQELPPDNSPSPAESKLVGAGLENRSGTRLFAQNRQTLANFISDSAPLRKLYSSATGSAASLKDRIFGSHVVDDVLAKPHRAGMVQARASDDLEAMRQRAHQAGIWPHHLFDALSVFMIICNTVLIGLETDHMAKTQEKHEGYQTAQVVLNVWYIVELFFRVCIAKGPKFFRGRDRFWNMFDVLMVGCSAIDLCVNSDMQLGRLIRVIRLVRIARTVRMLRHFSYVREFRKMIFALSTSGPTLFCSFFLLFIVIYAFAVWLTQGVAQHRAENPQASEELTKFYGTILQTIFTLYLGITSGISWGEAAAPLFEVSDLYVALLLVFISFTFFGVLNIIMSVFVESAMLSAQRSRELMLEETSRAKEVYSAHLRSIFKDIDTDGSGCVSLSKITARFESDHNIRTYFEALDINVSDARRLFELLDADESGEVDLAEFCDGCTKVKGDASSFDVHCLIYEQRRMLKWMSKFMAHVEGEFHHLSSDNERLNRGLSQLSRERTHSQLMHLRSQTANVSAVLSPELRMQRMQSPTQVACGVECQPLPLSTLSSTEVLARVAKDDRASRVSFDDGLEDSTTVLAEVTKGDHAPRVSCGDGPEDSDGFDIGDVFTERYPTPRGTACPAVRSASERDSLREGQRTSLDCGMADQGAVSCTDGSILLEERAAVRHLRADLCRL